MDDPVTITPDAPQVTITPDKPGVMRQIYEGDPNAPMSRFMTGAGLPYSMADVGPWLKKMVLPHLDESVHPTDSFFSALNEAAKRVPVLGPMYEASENAITKPEQAAPHQNPTVTRIVGAVPVVGPMANQVAENLSTGNYAGAAGGVAGAVAMARPGAVSDAAAAVKPLASRAVLLGKTPEEAVLSALKPSTRLSEAARADVAQTILREKIPISAGGVEKMYEAMGKLDDQLSEQIGDGQGKSIDAKAAASKADQTAERFAEQVDPEADVSAVQGVKDRFLARNQDSIPADKAQAMKTGTYQVLRGKYGEQGSAAVEAQKAIARGIKEELETQFPDLHDINARLGDFYKLQPVLEHAVARIGNHQLIGIGTSVAAGGVKAVTGSGALATVAATMKAVLDNPFVKSKLAIALSNAQKVPYATATARVNSYAAAVSRAALLGSGQSPAASGDQTTNAEP